MKDSKKNRLSKVSSNGVSILERYRQLKGERPASDLSQKIMEITRAGGIIAYPQDWCVTCDALDVCNPCDISDMFCTNSDDTDWCVFTDACDINEVLDPNPENKDLPPQI